MSQSKRIVIVGGGFAGLSLAAKLAQAGLSVTLLEASKLGFGMSSRNQGWLYSGGWFAREQTNLAKMCYESLQHTIKFCPECLEPDQEGMLYIFSKPGYTHTPWKHAWADAGIPFEQITKQRAIKLLPGFDPGKLHHAFMLPDRSFRPDILLEALAATARNAGVEIRTETFVTDLLYTDNIVQGVHLGEGEVIRARQVVLATGASLENWSHFLKPAMEMESNYTRVRLKSHLVSVSPDLGPTPFCVVDAEGFNHAPHRGTSVFGTGRWYVVHKDSDKDPDPVEINSLWEDVQTFFPDFKKEDHDDIHEWAGTMTQVMHIDQIYPGQAPLPTVINHVNENPSFQNLWSVSPGRATLWPQLAEEAREKILTDLGSGPLKASPPPWLIQ